MPPKHATVLSPPVASSSPREEAHSAHSLAAVGVETVLGAMIKQRRASQPSYATLVVPAEDSSPPARDPKAVRLPVRSEVFLKAR